MLLEARKLLLGIEYRSANYQDALLQAQQILAVKPDAKDVANFLPTLKVLAPFMRQTVVSREASTISFELLEQNLVLPITIDGSTVNYKPATVLLEKNNSTSTWFKGNLGMDLLNQAGRVDVDFGSMTLSLK